MSAPRRLPDRIPDDIEVSDIDLDEEEFIYQGERLTEARAEEIAEEVHTRDPGRPSLSAPGTRSPQVTVRLPQATKDALDAAAEREGRRSSELVRDALERYLAEA